ncbi:universal stress protein, partial [Protofrankia sp. BMG5.30]
MVDAQRRAPVLVGVDGSAGSEAALRWAYRTAALECRPVTALLAWTADGLPRNVYREATAASHRGLTRAAAEMLDRSVARVPMPDPPVEVSTRVVNTDTVSALLQHGEQAAMTVVGAAGHGPLGRLLVGSVSQGLVHHASRPVVVVRGTDVGERSDQRPM